MFRRNYSSYLVAAVPKTAVPVPRPAAKAKTQPSIVPLIYTPQDLLHYFHNPAYALPSKAQLTAADSLFYNSRVSHEWTASSYDQIPDIKHERLQQERELQLSKLEAYKRTEYHETLANSRTSFGIDPSLLRPLPEVLLLGHTNAGKSTLINNLLLSKHDAKTANLASEHAYVSKREGYTKCLNCYNVGNKLRLVDSPGYGRFGEETQGQAVLDYLQNRPQLRRTFVILDSMQELREEDGDLVDHLTEIGVPFEVIFTKIDALTLKIAQKVRKSGGKHAMSRESAQDINSRLIEHFQRLIDESGLAHLASLPRILFNNSHSNKILGRRHGFHHIRHAIAESCGLVTAAVAELPEASASGKIAKSGKAVRSLQITRRGGL